ncbi:hypothetical protein [Streptomyces sp. WMMC905]|uniref:hypothetical protein n=1 Tax=Streptomyces sp. WMMC905 TaxID=3404123 RepID=UPI003B957793
MRTDHLPQQASVPPGGHKGAPSADPAPRTPPSASEATRFLCAGNYLDTSFRDRVLDELDLNAQRVVAPSLGIDAARVHAHALRARRAETSWSRRILGLWFLASLFASPGTTVLLFAGFPLWLAKLVRGSARDPAGWRGAVSAVLRWSGRLLLGLTMVGIALGVTGVLRPESDSSSAPASPSPSTGFRVESDSPALDPDLLSDLALVVELQSWVLLALFAGVAALLAWQRSQFARVMAAELSPDHFAQLQTDPAELSGGKKAGERRTLIRAEQHSPLIMYNESNPFCGAGRALDTWVLAVELRPDPSKPRQPISNRAVLERVRPMLEALRLPAEAASHPVRDRLRTLEIDECVFLPAEGLEDRRDAPYGPEDFEEHRAQAVEEGAERRRHFLRVRVGGWEEELVVTVFVRIHTQGRMLMLEIAPHVLAPVRADFREADRLAHRFRNNGRVGRAAWALGRVPCSPFDSVAVLWRAFLDIWRKWTGGYEVALAEGPAVSVRELAGADTLSLFQDMDSSRYLKGVQDRIANGVRLALSDAGYQTGEFVQKIVNISQGAVHIGNVDGGSSVAVGGGASASTIGGGDRQQKGTDTHDHT